MNKRETPAGQQHGRTSSQALESQTQEHTGLGSGLWGRWNNLPWGWISLPKETECSRQRCGLPASIDYAARANL